MLTNIKHSKIIHRIASFLRLPELLNGILRRYPIRKATAGGAVYRIRSLESFSIRDEVFDPETYDILFARKNVETFVDLGCNVGLVPCLMRERFGSHIKGLLVDANPAMVEECRWHLEANGLLQCRAVWGVIGGCIDATEQPFYLNKYNISSSALPFGESYPLPIGDGVKEIRVPSVDVGKVWRQYHGDRRIDFMKIDIEGSEMDFLEGGASVLDRVASLAIEWHKWCCSYDDIKRKMHEMSFRELKVVKEDRICGLALYVKEGRVDGS